MNLNSLIVFAAGAAVGSVVTWKLVKTKYEQIAQEEIDSVKEVFSRKNEQTEEVCENTENEGDDFVNYKRVIKDTGYARVSNEKQEEGDEDMSDAPYVISPEEFDELDDYDVESLTLYADGVLTDDFNNVIEDVDSLVGSESLDHFGEFEDDSVFVRNDRLKCDYEILADERNYHDLYPQEVEEE